MRRSTARGIAAAAKSHRFWVPHAVNKAPQPDIGQLSV